jgi:biopolymer transport protein ExbD
MPSIKLPRKSTDTDMTPFVDVAFLILAFFIMATKFKPPEPVEVETPKSVSSAILEEKDALLITIDKDNRVFLNVSSPKDNTKLDEIASGINTTRNLGLSQAELQNFKRAPIIGVPFSSLKSLLQLSQEEMEKVNQPGIPVLDTLNNELIWWIAEAKKAFAGGRLLYMIKGDNNSKFPTFEAVVNALKKNDEFKYNLITDQEEAPKGSELYKKRLNQ